MLLVLAAGCGGDGGSDPSQLVNKQWQLVSGEGITLIEGVDPLPGLAFGAGDEMGFTDGCNQYRGYYRLDGDSLEILDLASTLEACLPPDTNTPRDEMAMAYGPVLGKVTSWAIEHEQLVLSDADGNELLRYQVAVY